MRARRIGFLLVAMFSVIVFFVGQIQFALESPTDWFIALSILGILCVGLLLGHLLLIYHFRAFFTRTPWVALTIALLFVVQAIFSSVQLTAGSNWLAQGLYSTVGIWALVSIISGGAVVAAYLIQRDHGLPLIAVVLLVHVWGWLIVYRQRGGEELLLDVLSGQMPSALNALICLMFWVLPLGAMSFVWHTFKLVSRELSAEN